jgi:hypothetical protein
MNIKHMNRMKNTLIILLLVILVSGACKKSFQKDLSLTITEYQKLGMPDYNTPWGKRDYIRALSTLSNLRLYKPMSFPRKESKKSGKVFENFVNKESLSFVNDTALSLSEKAMEIQHFSGFQNDLRRMYSDNSKEEQYYNEELTDIYIFGFFVYGSMLDLAAEIMKSEDKVSIDVQSGLRSILYNYNNHIALILGEQLKFKTYSARDLKRLSMELSHSIIKNQKWFESASRQKISSELRSVIEKSPSGYVKNNFKEALKILTN